MATGAIVQITLGVCLALATTGLIVFAGSGEETRLGQQTQAQRAQAIETGAVLYDIHCRSCHGWRGEGVGQLGPPLNEAHFFSERLTEVGWAGTLEEYLIATIAAGRVTATRPLYAGDGGAAVMNAWSNRYGGPLRDDQIRDLAAFILNWRPTALGQVKLAEITLPPLDPASQPEAIDRGRQLFNRAGCGGCHTLTGVSRGQGGPELDHIGVTAASRQPGVSAEDYLREAFLVPNAYYVPGYDPVATEMVCGGILSETQLDDLVIFLLSRQ